MEEPLACNEFYARVRKITQQPERNVAARVERIAAVEESKWQDPAIAPGPSDGGKRKHRRILSTVLSEVIRLLIQSVLSWGWSQASRTADTG